MAKHQNCKICGKPIVLVPSAKERARKYGYSEKFYLNLFQEHSECLTAKRQRQMFEAAAKTGVPQ